MGTKAAQQSLSNLRDLSAIQWYVIPLLALVFYVYAVEIKKARQSGNWNAVFAGLALFGMDLINEIWNGLVYHFTGYAACWMTPGPSALKLLIGWNIEIAFMFSIAGIIFAHTLLDDKNTKILGIPNRWFFAVAYSAFCVFVEILLNAGGHLVWEYSFWNASFKGVWLIFFFGYFHFFVVALLVHDMEKLENKIKTVAAIYAVGIASLTMFVPLGWI